MQAISSIQTTDQTLNRIQQNILTPMNQLIANAILNNGILPSVALASGSTIVNHKLGRTLQGWIIVRQRALASIYDNQDSNTDQTNTLILVSDNAVVVDILVF